MAAASTALSRGGTTARARLRRDLCGLAGDRADDRPQAARYSNIFDGMRVVNSGLSHSVTSRMSAVASRGGHDRRRDGLGTG